MSTFRIPLLDGALARKADQPTSPSEIIEAMAADLLRDQAFGAEDAAIRTLSGLGYGFGDIVNLVDEARARATELAVAREMAKP